MFFAGIWTNQTSTRKVKEGEVNADLFAFLTTGANGAVGAAHPKAMPVTSRPPFPEASPARSAGPLMARVELRRYTAAALSLQKVLASAPVT